MKIVWEKVAPYTWVMQLPIGVIFRLDPESDIVAPALQAHVWRREDATATNPCLRAIPEEDPR